MSQQSLGPVWKNLTKPEILAIIFEPFEDYDENKKKHLLFAFLKANCADTVVEFLISEMATTKDKLQEYYLNRIEFCLQLDFDQTVDRIKMLNLIYIDYFLIGVIIKMLKQKHKSVRFLTQM
jgi:hypothetical protein